MQQEKTDTVIAKDLLGGVNDKEEIALILKTHIKRLLENLNGLRKQNRELNGTIRGLRQVLLEKKQ
jgi:hypothetical protein